MNGLNPTSLTDNNFFFINGQVSNKASIKYGVPLGLFPGQLLFLIYFNDLNQTIKFYKFIILLMILTVHFSKSGNKLNKYINIDIKNVSDWLNANKI